MECTSSTIHPAQSLYRRYCCTTLTPSSHALLRTPENDWECLGTTVFFRLFRGPVVPQSRRPVVLWSRGLVVPQSRRPAVSSSRSLVVPQSRRLVVLWSRSLVVSWSRRPVVPQSRRLVVSSSCWRASQPFSAILRRSQSIVLRALCPLTPTLLRQRQSCYLR